MSATTCSQRHLHHDLNTGAVELLDLTSGEPAEPGALSTVVVTPYHPFRECMPVFRYDTRDVVRTLDDAPLTCEIAGLPGTSQIVGKADQILSLGPHDVITPRDLVEAVESLPSQPWPSRFRADIRDNRLRLTLPVGAVAGLDEQIIRQHFTEHGLDASLNLIPDDEAGSLRLLRCDLRETTFVNHTTAVGDRHASR